MEVNNSNVDGSESSSDSERQIDVIIGENNYLDTDINRTKSLSSSGRRSSSSSSSSESSSDVIFDALKLTASDASKLASKSEKNYASSSDSSAKSEVDNSLSVPTTTYQVYNVAYNQTIMSPTISPPIQVMDRSARYDPARIPSSIFERNTNNDWSIASNDSLFSIHIGQNSFSRDAFKFAEPRKSSELTKPIELNMLDRIQSVSIEEVESSRKSDDIESLQISEESFKFKPNFIERPNDVRTLHQAARSMSTKSSVTTPSLQSGSIRHAFVPL
ncbi:hypothetical protein MtrunA17_Chr5g0419541 [Medicago truncatula]|uniref:Uncharacterized protein n=1 Tax=Medicago truncatula TaxID=3880 RepID=A0A396HUF3_MEDTR|nr:hypothetical protein MtrunA17_Chr5g0419541 [Medicago truncatula]